MFLTCTLQAFRNEIKTLDALLQAFSLLFHFHIFIAKKKEEKMRNEYGPDGVTAWDLEKNKTLLKSSLHIMQQ